MVWTGGHRVLSRWGCCRCVCLVKLIRLYFLFQLFEPVRQRPLSGRQSQQEGVVVPVSYTHTTLPTTYAVLFSVLAGPFINYSFISALKN